MIAKVEKQSTGTVLLKSPRCECTGCGNVFSVPGNFDAHRKFSSRENQNYCLEPASVGLSLSDKGVWIKEQEWFNKDD